MKYNYKRQLIIASLILGILISFSFFVIGYRNFLNPKLGTFEIEKIVENDSLLYMYVTSSHNAVSYKVTAEDENRNIIYEKISESNIILLDDFYTNYGDTIIFQVEAYNKNSEGLISKNEYKYISSDISISLNNEHYIKKDSHYIVNLVGDIKEDSYTLEVYYEDLLLKSISVDKNSVLIDKEILNDLSGKVVLKLKKNGKRVTSTYNLYANSPIVGNISITNLEEQAYVSWDDLIINYEGGENATSAIINLFKNGRLMNTYETEFTKNSVILPANYLEENSLYTLELIAIYKDYMEIAKKAQITLSVGQKETVKPVYVDYNYKNIKENTKITLSTNTLGATIYYTLDGSEPTTNSLIYKVPLVINKDVTIKTKAVRKNMYDSVVNTYDFHIGRKDVVVYLSPSNQYGNYGIKNSGYTTEKAMMNKLTDYLKPYLESYGVKVYRNNPSGDINAWLSESNYVKSDLHLALHSNASSEHTAHGIEIYIDNASSKSLSIANKIYNNLYSIYPNKGMYTNRGVKYSEKSLGEANDSFIPCGTLIEIAYHDYYDDAKWMVDNLEEIAKNIGDSILDYYQIK